MHRPQPEEMSVLADLPQWLRQRLDRRDESILARPDGVTLPPITADGIGMSATWRTLSDEILPSTWPTDHPRYLAFVGGAATVAGVLADVAVSASNIYAGSELEAGAVVAAEAQALRWLADVIGLPAGAHGAFVSGGSLANLSALVAARHGRRGPNGAPSVIIAAANAHSSVHAAAAIMGCDIRMAGSPDHALTRADLLAVVDDACLEDVVAVVASAGATNTGVVDRLDEIADVCAVRGLWLHVDAAYGGAAMLSASTRDQFAGIERADSVTIDPHKWLFAPFECAAIVYRDPARARAAHRQSAHYLDAVNTGQADNPSDYAIHLTRRARGLPLWASLVANGVDAYRDAVEQCLQSATYAAKQIEASEHLELVAEPSLSVVLFRHRGWTAADYVEWSVRSLRAGDHLVTPTQHAGETVLRLCFVNPLTTEADVDLILETLC